MLYNHKALHLEADGPAMVVEGVFDALPYWPNAAAMLGKPSIWQVQAMSCSSRPVVVVMDGDAHEEGWALAQVLRFNGIDAKALRLPPKTDPNDDPTWVKEEIRKL
jgi:hypothetical protein